MRANANTEIWSRGVVLVPYKEQHVLKYHEWMKDPFLQEMTASEPLTLDEEYRMQKSWLEDSDKCTFIVLDRETYERTGSQKEAMIGDVNLFLNNGEDPREAEIEVMIAESGHRRRGKGKEAILLMMRYGVETLEIDTFVAKIKLENGVSLRLFEKLGFVPVSTSEVFGEATHRLRVDDGFRETLLGETKEYVTRRSTS